MSDRERAKWLPCAQCGEPHPGAAAMATHMRWHRGLSDKQAEVLRLLSLGLDNIEMGVSMGISPNTITSMIFEIRRKVDLPGGGHHRRIDLVAYAMVHGYADPESPVMLAAKEML